MSSHPPPGGGQPSDGKGLFELVVVTVPAALLYFMGWAYLYFYLKAFGIGISELDLDIQTIFVYSYPPVRIFWRSYWPWILGAIVVLVVSLWAGRRLTTKLAALYSRIFGTSPVLQGLLLFLMVSLFAVLLVPAVQVDAVQAADRKWVSEGVNIEAIVKDPETKEKSAWYENYKRCASRRALDLIFADKDSYYMLCISSVDETSALVFEVRRDAGLASVRFARR